MKNHFSKLIPYFTKHKATLIAIFVFSATSAILTVLAPFFVGKTIDAFVLGTSTLHLFVLLFLCYFALLGSNLLLNHFSAHLASVISHDLRNDLLEKLNKLSISYFDKTPYGNILNHFSVDCNNIANGILQSFSKLIMGIVTVLVSIFLLLSLNVPLAFLLFLSAPMMYFLSRFITTHTKSNFEKRATKMKNLTAYSEEIIHNWKMIQDFSYETIAFQNFAKKSNELSRSGIQAQFFSSLTNPLTRLVTNFFYILIGITSIFLAGLQKISIGNISTFLMYITIFTRPFNEITSILSEIQTALSSSKQIFAFLEEPEEIRNSSYALPLESLEGNILFQDVTFSYGSSTPVLNHLNLEIKKGERIAIVGKTGSGKTTLVNLLMRFYELAPNSGKILMDGIPITDIPRDFLRSNIGMVLQDTKLFAGTIRENIAYGKPNASEEEIIEAAKSAYADEFIQRLPNGYDTILKEGDTLLSAGEVQLITIARILLLHPPILILDEATSNVDFVTEANLQKAFAALQQNATSLVIAHRLSTIQNADCIYFMENGKIIEQGTHKELLARKGNYYHLYESQFGD